MGNDSNLIIISASSGKNLDLSNDFQKKSQELNISSEILDLTTLDIPLYNPRIHSNKDIPDVVNLIKEKLLNTITIPLLNFILILFIMLEAVSFKK